MRTACSLAVLVTLALSAPTWAQTPLPMDTPASGSASESGRMSYTFRADASGVLTVAVDGTGDLVLQLHDASGQLIPDGASDRDLNGSTGTEILTVAIRRAGDYRLDVAVLGGGTSEFQIAGAFLAFPALELPPDPDGSPDGAVALTIGEGRDDALDTAKGDAVDWFVLEPTEDATLAIVTRSAGTEVDLQLDVYLDGNFADSVDHSDQDQQGDTANEAVTVAVRAGQIVHVKVSGVMDSTTGPYRISSSLIAR